MVKAIYRARRWLGLPETHDPMVVFLEIWLSTCVMMALIASLGDAISLIF